jgi:hypothetical protein
MKVSLVAVCLAAAASAQPPANPLDCFVEEPDSAKPAFNVCNGQYTVKTDSDNASLCATKCLADPKCVQFVHAVPTYGDPKACRLSYTCTKTTSFYEGVVL